MTMRNRKTIITAFVLAACLLIGVGYAALTTTLEVKGSVNLTEAGAEAEVDEDVYFTTAVATNCVANVDAQDPDIVIVRLTDTSTKVSVAGDTASFVATVKNDSKAAATITPNFTAIDSTLATYLQFSTDNSTYTVNAGDTVEIAVTITLKTAIPEGGILVGGVGDYKAMMSFNASIAN